MATKTLRVFAEYTSTGFVPMPTAGNIDYGYTLGSTFPATTPTTFQTDNPDLVVTVTAMTDFYVWIRVNGSAWNPSYTRNVRVYPDSPNINNVVMNMIIATGPAGVSSYTQIVQTSNRLYFNGATTDAVYNSKFAGKTYINELNFGTAPGLATVATSGAYADLTGKPSLATVATSGLFTDLSSKPSGTAPLSYNSGTNSFVITQANTSTNGFLSSTDWNTFNNKYLLPAGGTTAQYVNGAGTLTTFPTTLDSKRLIMSVRNETGATLTKGTVVYIVGIGGNTPLVSKAIASSDSTSAQTLGVLDADINNNQSGTAVLVGQVATLDTSSFTEGVQLYLSGTTAGTYTSTKSLAPTHLVYVGIVTRSHPTQGVIEVKIQNGYELNEIHDVQISSPADKHILYYDNATTLWKHSSVTSVLGFTPYNATNPSNYIALTALSASAPLSYNNTTGAFSIAQANGSTNGFLSSTDWTTFNSKQNALTLGNVSEVSSNVLMFPDGTTGKTIGNLSIQVVQAGATTNGFLSSANWTTFNNKQNALTFGNFTEATSSVLTITGGTGAVIGSGLSVQVKQANTTTNGFLSSTDWNTFNGKLGSITLTTTGTSGAATYSAGTLNIPQYQAVLTNPVTGTGTSGYLSKWTSTSAINASQVYDNGTSIGIGSTTISGKLSVYLNSSTVSATSITAWDATCAIFGNTGSTSNALSLSFNSTSNTAYLLSAQPGVSWRSMWFGASDYKFTVNQGATPAVTITSAGNVGILTSSPSFALDVNGNGGNAYIRANTSGSSNWSTLLLQNGDGSWHVTNDDTGTFNIGTGNDPSDLQKLTITSTGRVGIGTTLPSAKLTVIGDAIIQSPSSGYIFEVRNASENLMFKAGAIPGGIINIQGQVISNSAVYPIFLNYLGGNVIIGPGSDAGYRLYVSGTIYATGNITANSDLTLKKNLKLIENPAEKLMLLNGYSYQWKENNEYQYGVIAQEVEKVMSYAVSTGKTGIKGVSYNQLTPLLIEGFKLHNSEITQLKARVKYLESKLA